MVLFSYHAFLLADMLFAPLRAVVALFGAPFGFHVAVTRHRADHLFGATLPARHRCASQGRVALRLVVALPSRCHSAPARTHPAWGGSRLPAVRKAAPVIGRDVDVVLFGRCLDPFPRPVPFGVTDAFDLIESGDRVANMRRVGERLLAFVRERERGVTKSILGGGAQGL
jgi:hypothetical protein